MSKHTYDEALECIKNNDIQRAIELLKDINQSDIVLRQLGDLYHYKTNEIKKAIEVYEKLVRIAKDAETKVIALNEIGVCYSKIEEYELSIEYYKKTFEYTKTIPDIFRNIAIVYNKMRKFSLCEKYLLKTLNVALPYQKDDINKALGDLCYYTKKYDESIGYYKAIKNKTDDTLYSLSSPYLGKKDFRTGFMLYENRLKENKICTHNGLKERVEIQWIPYWNGKTECNKLLVIYEQGMGDNIMFFRFMLELANRYPQMKIGYFCKNEIQGLFKTYTNIEIVKNVDIKDMYEYKIYMMSLPYILGISSISPCVENYIRVDDDKLEKWRKIIKSDKLNVGVCCRGALTGTFIEKEMPMAEFENLLDLDVNLISLHRKCDTVCSSDKIQSYDDLDVDEPFSDTIAILRLIDVLVTVDTSLVHIAGVMGVKTILMLGYGSDWRWFDTSEKVWYNSVEILRLNEQKHLKHIIPEVKNSLLNHSKK